MSYFKNQTELWEQACAIWYRNKEESPFFSARFQADPKLYFEISTFIIGLFYVFLYTPFLSYSSF